MTTSRSAVWPVLLILAAALSACGSEGDAGKPTRPNLILLTVESLRAPHLGLYGYHRDTSPQLDRLADEAIVYPNAYSVTSWTLASHATLFTGLYPSAHQVTDPTDRLGQQYETAAELLSEAGYQTAGFATGPYLTHPFELNQGFEIYDDSAAPPPNEIDRELTNPALEQQIFRFLEEQRDPERPFFLFAYYWDPHYAYIPPAPYDEMFVPEDAVEIDVLRFDRNESIHADMPAGELAYLLSQYDGEIRYTDEYLGRLFDRLRELDLWDDTALLVTSDHAEEFFEHGNKGHKKTLHVESLHVPLLFKPPRGLLEPGRDERVVAGVDFLPTLLDLAQVERQPPHHGRSLLEPAGTDPRATYHELVTSWYFQRPGGRMQRATETWQAVQLGDYKLIEIDQAGRDQTKLHHLPSDPGELTSLTDPTKASRLESELASFRERMQRFAALYDAPTQATLTEADLEVLRAMGYLQDGR